MSIQKVIKTNWKNQVRYRWEGGTLSELKELISGCRKKEENDYDEWLIRKSPEFKQTVQALYYN